MYFEGPNYLIHFEILFVYCEDPNFVISVAYKIQFRSKIQKNGPVVGMRVPLSIGGTNNIYSEICT